MERVFPIRCTIFEDSPNLAGDHQKTEIDQHRTVLVQLPEPKAPIDDFRPRGETSPGVDSERLQTGELRQWPPSVAVEEVLETPKDPQLVYTEQSEYAFSDKDGHGIVSGKREHISRCEDEPIRMPGSIQSHGMLIGLERIEESDQPRYECRVVSENSQAICKYSPRVILQQDNFIRVFPTHQRHVFESQAKSVIALFKQTSKSAEPKIFNISFMDPSGCIIPAWCAMHFLGGDHNLLVCEFELEAHSEISPGTPDDVATTPFNSLASDPFDAAATASFISMSEPLHVGGPRSDLFQGQGRTIEVVNVMSQIQQQLSATQTTQGLLDAIVGVISELTEFHRCMVYQFDEAYNGTVVAELATPQASSDVYRGLHFPASDIPKQARDLYKINRVRTLFDRELEPSRLICRNVEDLATPVDLTHSYLRAISPVHLKYLGNMGVKSTMSISLDYRDDLWGLVVCHSYGPKGLRVPFPLRELCYWVGMCASNCLDKLLNAEKLRARNSLISMQIDVSPQLCISASSDDLLRLFQADFGFLVVKGEARTIGKLSSYPEAVTLLRYVYFRNFTTTYATKAVSKDFTDLVFEPGFSHIAGLLYIPLSHDAGDFIVFFRKNQVVEVHWAGNPNMAKIGALEPRNSFKKWTETVKKSSRPWTDEQFEAAAMTRLVYGNFIRVWREKETTLHESRMKRLLLLNLSHEVRTPLNAVVNYLEIALEKRLDQETKDVLTESHSASKSLIYVIDDLLNLTGNAYQAPLPMIHVIFDIRDTVHTTLDRFQKHATQKGLSFEISEDDIPQYVCSDLQRFQQALTQLVTNALNHTEKGGVKIHLRARLTAKDYCVIQVSVQDTGIGITERELDRLFQEFEQVPDEDVDSGQVTVSDTKGLSTSKKSAKLGLGLALVARYIKQCGGRVRGASVAGRGSIFSLDIPMQLGKEDELASVSPSVPTSTTPSGLDEDRSENIARRPALSSAAPTSFQKHLDRVRGHSERSPARSDRGQGSVLAIRSASPRAVREPRPASSNTEKPAFPNTGKPVVLIADDNSVNLTILKRRLEKMGHQVKTSVDGQDCFDVYQEHWYTVHLILMDISMPIVDGIQSTRMIRTFESVETPTPGAHPTEPAAPPPLETTIAIDVLQTSKPTHTPTSVPPISPPPTNLGPEEGSEGTPNPGYFNLPLSPSSSDLASTQDSVAPPIISPIELPPAEQEQERPKSATFVPRRIPIFAVSAGLDQHSQESLEDAGFDGWMSKPIDFKKLAIVIEGVLDHDRRVMAKSRAGDYADGGWFR